MSNDKQADEFEAVKARDNKALGPELPVLINEIMVIAGSGLLPDGDVDVV